MFGLLINVYAKDLMANVITRLFYPFTYPFRIFHHILYNLLLDPLSLPLCSPPFLSDPSPTASNITNRARQDTWRHHSWPNVNSGTDYRRLFAPRDRYSRSADGLFHKGSRYDWRSELGKPEHWSLSTDCRAIIFFYSYCHTLPIFDTRGNNLKKKNTKKCIA